MSSFMERFQRLEREDEGRGRWPAFLSMLGRIHPIQIIDEMWVLIVEEGRIIPAIEAISQFLKLLPHQVLDCAHFSVHLRSLFKISSMLLSGHFRCFWTHSRNSSLTRIILSMYLLRIQGLLKRYDCLIWIQRPSFWSYSP